MVMVWLEGGQGEVRGACAPPPPTPQIALPGPPPPQPPPRIAPLGPPPPQRPSRRAPPPAPPKPPPPIRPSLHPPSNAPPPPPPPQGASGQQLVGGVVGVQNRGVAPPPPRGVEKLRSAIFRNFPQFRNFSQFSAIFRNFPLFFRNFSAIFLTSRFSDCLPTLVQNSEKNFFLLCH